MTASVLDVRLFVEPADPRLRRHQVHDPRSRAFELPPVALPTRPVYHERRCPIFDQGRVGSCTANAGLGVLAAMPTGPVLSRLTAHGVAPERFVEDDALALYHEETLIDDREIPGHYPPDDTGSAGIYLCKALQARGWVKSYRHAFDVTTALGWLGQRPVAIGIPWLNSMFTPGQGGLVPVDRSSGVAGGHEVALTAIDPVRSLVRFDNSWSEGWGDHGRGWLRYTDLAWLLSQGGDAVVVF